MLQAVPTGRLSIEALIIDRTSARLAPAVTAVLETVKCGLHLVHFALEGFEHRQLLLAVERLAPHLGRLLVCS